MIKPKVVYIVNPNNPTGTLHSSDDLLKLITNNQNVLFIVDEAYYEFSKETREELFYNKGKLLRNGERWESELANNINLDAPYR